MRRILSTSRGPEPFPGVQILEPYHAQQPGEVLICYELEAAAGCSLNAMGWCCFGALCCVALPLSWLPFVCDGCKRKAQRPVYGYPVDYASFLTATDAAWHTHKAQQRGVGGGPAAAPPTIHCMDISLVEPAEVKQDQQQQQPQQPPQLVGHRAPGQLELLGCSPSPPPMSIFVPPSAVPACGFTCDNPFPSRYSPAPSTNSAHSPMAFMAHGQSQPQPASPRPGTGLPLVGMMDEEQQERELAHQQQQQQQALQQQVQVLEQQVQVLLQQQQQHQPQGQRS